jgi:hypothetical protein
MRIENVVSSYQHHHGNEYERMKNRKKQNRGHRSAVLIYDDTIELSDNEKKENDSLNWFSTYIKLLPESIVSEKIKQTFSGNGMEDDALVQKLLFEIV